MLRPAFAGIAVACFPAGAAHAEAITIDATAVTFSGVELNSDIQYSTQSLGLMRNEF